MLIPILTGFVVLFVVLIVLGVRNKSRRILAATSIIWWLCSFVSAFFVGWAWMERGYSENWAMYGVFFISGPIIIITGAMAISVIVAVRVRKIENMRRITLSLYPLLLFLLVQLVAGVWAG